MAIGAYDANAIWQYGEDDNIALFSDLLKLGTLSTSAAFTADRARLATLEAGSLAGLIPVKATSVVVATGSAAVSTNGSITFTGASSLSLNGVFSAAYRNYLIVLTGASTTAGGVALNLRYRTAGVDQASTTYRYAGTDLFLNSASAVSSSPSGAWAGTSTSLGTLSESGLAIVMDIMAPALAAVTQSQATSTSSSVAGGYLHAWNAQGMYAAATVFDGFSLIPASLLMSGTLTVYGYNN
jgi:hypothetical protein